jgi:hypothetical protein
MSKDPQAEKGKNPPDMFPEMYFENQMNAVGSGSEIVNKVASNKAIASNLKRS